MKFYIRNPISKDRLMAAAQKIYGASAEDLEIVEDINRPGLQPTRKRGLNQDPVDHVFGTVIFADDTSLPVEAARALAVEGGVDVLWYDIREDSDEGEWDWAGYAIAPYILFKPDGSEHKARLDEERPNDDRWLGDKLIVLD